MVKKDGYEWNDPNDPPLIEAHSLTKHEVIRFYLERYIEVLTKDPHIDKLRLNIVDGFAGGGRYRDENGQICDGSPLIFLKTVQASEAAIKLTRTKDFRILGRFYFVEEDPRAAAFLKTVLSENYFRHGDGSPITLIQQPFADTLTAIIDDIKTAGKKRTIFLLDQYGYKDVPFGALKTILTELPDAEIVMTFATDALINYMCTTDEYLAAIRKLQLDNILTKTKIEEIKAQEPREARFAVQRLLHESFISKTGAKFYTPFFITSSKSSRSYWLVHLSGHTKARDEMTKAHWAFKNHFSHYGLPGLNMLGFKPDADLPQKLQQGAFDFYFDDSAETRTTGSLLEDIPRALHDVGEITFSEFFTRICNTTPAHSDQIKEALIALVSSNILVVFGQGNRPRRTASGIKGNDAIVLKPQGKFNFPFR